MRLARTCVALAAIALGATACTGDPAPSVAPSVSPTVPSEIPSPTETPTLTSTPSPLPSPSPTEFQSFPPPPAEETEEQAAIRAAWQQYLATIDEILRNPEILDFTETQRITTGEEANRIFDEMAAAREANIMLEGDRLYRDVEISIPNANPSGTRTASITYCFDPEFQRIVDADSGEPYATARTSTLKSEVRMELGADARWRVAKYSSWAEAC